MKIQYLDSKIHYFLFALIFLYLFILNIFLPPQADDIQAAIHAKDGINSAIRSYIYWNARIGELLFVGFVAGFSDLVFDFTNAIIGSIFIYMFFIFTFARLPNNKKDLYCIVLICFLILYFAPFGADFLWGAGSLNYMWGILIMMIALYPYRIFWNNIFTNKQMQIIKPSLIPLFIISSICAGMASEQLGIITILVHIGFLIYATKNKIKLNIWYYLGVICFIIGYLCLYFSPGNAARASMSILEGQFLKIDELIALPLKDKINRTLLLLDYSITNIFKAFILLLLLIIAKIKYPNNTRILYISFILLIASLIILSRNGATLHIATMILLCSLTKQNKIYKIICILYIIYLLLCLSGIQILILPPRARFGEILILISAFCILYQFMKYSKLLNIAISIICIAYGAFVASEYYKFYNKWNEMLAYIESQKKIGNYDVVVENIFISKYPNFIDSLLPTDVTLESPNPLYAHKFGLKSFRVDDYYKDIK